MNKKLLTLLVLFTTSLVSLTAFGQDANKYRGGSYSGYAMGTSAPNITLPVELTSFTASTGSGLVVLHWVTESGTGNLGFNIHRSLTDTSGYKKINWSMIKGAGDSYTPREYSYDDKDVQNGVTYYYKLEQVDIQGHSTFYGPVFATPQAGLQPSTPAEYALSPNFPNPFNPGTAIEYQLPKPSKITIKIFNLLGQDIRTLVDEEKQAGYFAVHWDGRDSFGSEVANGIYIYTLEAHTDKQRNFVDARKMLLLR